ncbi:MAG: hypothetical protein KAG61_09300 [Bacteriovoracaceae bacterium]|nr:hypothetical protein [Bacteriovoracaceae bacterium]
MKIQNIAGLCLKGGRKDNFYFCLLEDFQDNGRLFLKSLLRVQEEDDVIHGDEAIRKWIDKYSIQDMVIDFPLSSPACKNCKLDCDGRHSCRDSAVSDVTKKIDELLKVDNEVRGKDPKAYERERNLDDEIDYSRDVINEKTDHHILSRPFKRRLRKGYLPYWNRPIDFYIWTKYYDQLLKMFNISYDSFGNTSLMLYFRLDYLKRHFPLNFSLYEANVYIFMVELLRAKVLRKRDLEDFLDIESGADARFRIIEAVEKKFSIFIYESDKETLVKFPHAFQSFVLALVGWLHQHNQSLDIPEWARPNQSHFLIPKV